MSRPPITEMQRMWINQPSEHHALHHMHGTRVLGAYLYDNTYKVFPTEGPIISMLVERQCLSYGWSEPL